MSYREAFVIHLFTTCGGGERVSLEMARALQDHGVRVTYLTSSRKELDRCRELMGVSVDYNVIEVRSYAEQLLGLTGRFLRVRRLLMLGKIYREFNGLEDLKVRGLTIDTRSNHPSNAHVVYIHYPVLLSTAQGSGGLHWRAYNWLVRQITRSVRGEPDLVLTNSSWTAGLVEKMYSIKPAVLHPPIDFDYLRYNGEKKDKAIITISRFSPEKNLHMIPMIAKKLPEYTWYIVGSTGAGMEKRVSRAVIKKIQSEARKQGVDSIQILPDLPRSELRKLLLKASFYIHPRFPEHFGIAVAEAMSAGAIPVVYRDGGVWSDVVSPVDRMLGYSDLEEIPRIVRSIERNESLMNNLREKAIARAGMFRPEIFRERFIELLKQSNLI